MIDLDAVLQELAIERPIFQSEADFQHALAWRIHRLDPSLGIRLECCPIANDRSYLDLLISSPIGKLACELKYFKASYSIDIEGEPFRLDKRGAYPLGRFDFVKDLVRLERVSFSLPMTQGVAILLTNDASYWSESRRTGGIDAAFRLHEGSRLAGRLDWASHTGTTKNDREEPLALRGEYELRWRDYSNLGGANGRFRCLVVPVHRPEITPPY